MVQKKYVAIDVDTKGNREDKSGLNPEKTRLAVISMANEEYEKINSYPDESRMLLEFNKVIEDPNLILVGFNFGFDMNMLSRRAEKYGIKLNDLTGRVIDIKDLLPRRNGKQNLDGYAKDIGYKFCFSGFSKSQFHLLWEYPDVPELRDLFLEDSKITWTLFCDLQSKQPINRITDDSIKGGMMS